MRKNRSKSSKTPKKNESKDEQNKIMEKSAVGSLSSAKQLELI